MAWSPDNLRTKGALSAFHQALEAVPTVWDKHCQIVKSTTNAETYTFPGFVPEPREFLNSRQFVGMRDFTYSVTNQEFELSLIINRTHWEDDQNALIKARMSELAECWATFKDSQLTTLLANGNVAGNLNFSGTVYHLADHSAGTVGQTNDNLITLAGTGGGGATSLSQSEWITAVGLARENFWLMTDDQGRPFNSQALMQMRAIVHPNQEAAGLACLSANFHLGSGQDSAKFAQSALQGIDVLPYMASGDSDEIYFSALGGTRKPFIYQERTPLEIEILDDAKSVAQHNGVMVLTRQRYVMTYGEFRRSILCTVT